MKDSTDGFYIAEQDLIIRGPGELAGRAQSGYLNLAFASLAEDLELIEQARAASDRILQVDNGFLAPENTIIRSVLSEAPV